MAKVLDRGFVQLVDTMPHYRQPPSDTGLWAADARIVEAARTSLAALPEEVRRFLEGVPDEALGSPPRDTTVRTRKQDEGLIDYLVRKYHTTPLEKVRFEFFIRAPIVVARQWFRHRMGSYNEISARYAQLPECFYIPPLERMATQGKGNKQTSGDRLDPEKAAWCRGVITGMSADAYAGYEKLLDAGLARELARIVLPLNIYTQWYWTVDLHNLFGFLRLRLAGDAQDEIRVYAEAIYAMVKEVAPVASRAFDKYIHGHSPERTIRAEGKLAALVEWACQDSDASVTKKQLLEKIEGFFEVDELKRTGA